MNIIENKKGTVLVIRPTLKSINAKLRRSLKLSKSLRGRLYNAKPNEEMTEVHKALDQQRGYRGAIRRYVGAITAPRPTAKQREAAALIAAASTPAN